MGEVKMSEVTQVLRALQEGDARAANQLLPLIYNQLRQLAAHKLAAEAAGQTLQPTALVHEAYLRLVEKGEEPSWKSRGHFFAAAAEAMRRILVENARRKGRLKRGGRQQRLDFHQVEQLLVVASPDEDLLAVDEAVNQLSQEDPQKAELIKLRFFAGLSLEETAHCLGISRATANRHLAYARAWLYDRLRSCDGTSEY
jgi:RNA polymerase sigma factor (TIGR02999 family)